MAITNPQAIQFTNQRIRPMCERVRAIKAEIDSIMAAWNGGVSDLITVNGGTLEDGRDAEGVSRITGNDIVGVVVQLAAIQTQLNGPGVAGVIEKPCVRDLRVQP